VLDAERYIVAGAGGEAMAPIPVPAQAPASEGFATVRGGAKLWYWDTGGQGPTVVFVHPMAGSARSWIYQQPVFAKSGYRVIAYSRRNHYNSDMADKENPGIASEDIQDLADYLKLGKFHLVGAAQGGNVTTDYAISHPERLLSLVLSSRTAGVKDGAVAKAVDMLKPEQWGKLPRWFQEIGPSYRAANPEGLKLWIEINETMASRKGGGRQRSANVISAEMLESMTVPTLLITGTADLTAPPSLVRQAARHIPHSEVVIVTETGHSLFWEQPDIFNRTVLDFFSRHP
jgi:pimeloyl-ACP methyl ester carboxylesterase